MAALAVDPVTGRHTVQLWPAGGDAPKPQQRPVVLASGSGMPSSTPGAAQGPRLQILTSRCARVRLHGCFSGMVLA